MRVDSKIIEEINRFNKITRYINEQEVPPPPGDEGLPPDAGAPMDAGAEAPPPPPGGDVPPPPAPGAEGATTGGTEVVDVENDPDVEKVDSEGETEGEEGTEELDITELVTTQKDIKDKQDSYFEELFGQLQKLEAKLGEMDNLVNKINSLEQAVERSRPKTPQEKLELRSLDSGPYNQKLTDFFQDKQQDIQKSGKNEYVLTSDEVENFSDRDIRDSFNIDMDKNFGI